MPRRRQPRKIVEPPKFKGYKPYGAPEQKGAEDAIELHYEEYEAIKLADYDGLTHHEACKKMDISRATFARIYESARKKIAKAFVETKDIKSVYGHAWLDSNWYHCKKCLNRFTIPQNNELKEICPVCKTEDIELINES